MGKIITKNYLKIAIGIFVSVVGVWSFFAFLPTKVAGDKSGIEIEMDGYGTQRYPYLVRSVEDIDNIRAAIKSGDNLLGKWFALVNDIDMQGAKIQPLAEVGGGSSFHGGFDGRGYKISNFVIDEGEREASFFGRIDGVVENLELEGIIKGEISASYAHEGYGVLLNCISNCEVSADKMAAGIVNNWDGVIQNIVFQGELVANDIDGIVNSGTGSAIQIYSKDYAVGNIRTIDDYEMIAEQQVDYIAEELNSSAKGLCFTSEYGRWLNRWIWYAGKVELADEIVGFRGLGVTYDPYLIDSIDKLEVLVEYINAGYTFAGSYFYQTVDIDMSGVPWIGLEDDSAIFCGTYDGNGHAISNLDTMGQQGGLFKNFCGKIINLKIQNCSTLDGCGFAGNMGSASLILNSYCDGQIGDTYSLGNLQQVGQLVNCYIEGLVEPTTEELNQGLSNLVVNYGIHCGELNMWSELRGEVNFGNSYKDKYLEKNRLYWEGSGAENDPYIIASLEDIVYLREMVYYNESFWRYWFLQNDDIDFSGVHYWRAVSSEGAANSFYGYYDGNGYKMLNFHQGNMSVAESGTIFGNVRGTIMNVHLINCQPNTNGILAYNVFPTGKILNNIIEVNERLDEASIIGVVNKNSGKILNNLIIASNAVIGVEEDGENKEADVSHSKGNQIVSELSSEVIETFNKEVLESALDIKQRITNFNRLSEINGIYTLRNDIKFSDPVGMTFVKRMVISNPLLAIVVLWTVIVSVAVFIERLCFMCKQKGISVKVLLQIMTLIIVYFAFVVSMEKLNSHAVITKATQLINLVLLLTLVVCMVGIVYAQRNEKMWCMLEKVAIKRNLPIVLALMITITVVVCNLDVPVAYDADLYYGSFQQAIQNFRFSVSGWMNSFSIASKPMHGIAMLMTIGEVLDPGTGRGVYLCNLLLLVVAQFCVYKIIQKLFPQFPDRINAVLSICFVFSGYVIAGATYINPDFYSVVSFVIFLCCVVYEYKIFAFFGGFLVICSKPNMIIAYFLFGFIWFIYEFKMKKIDIFKWLRYTLPASVYMILYFGVNTLNRVGVAVDSNNAFAYTFGSRMLQYFAYGFIWIQEIFIIVAIVVLIREKKLSILSDKKMTFLFSVWISCFSQLLITVIGGGTLQLCPRYLAVCAIKNILLFAMALEVLPLGEKKMNVLVHVLASLLIIQLFTTIDPAIILTTEVKNDNLHYLVFPHKDQDGNDLSFYNYEYCKDARYGSEILATLTRNEINNMYSDARTEYKMAIGSSAIYAAYWDMNRNCRTYIPNNDCVRLNMKSIVDAQNVRAEYHLKDYAVILRKTEEYWIETVISETKEHEEIGAFNVYYSND